MHTRALGTHIKLVMGNKEGMDVFGGKNRPLRWQKAC
jgi:hypothetical protein